MLPFEQFPLALLLVVQQINQTLCQQVQPQHSMTLKKKKLQEALFI